MPSTEDRIRGALLGGSFGDAAGLAFENMSPSGVARKWTGGPLSPCLPGRGLWVSDDTEHALFALRALRESGGDPEAFVRELGRGFLAWLAALPVSGGLGTYRAGAKLLLGWSPRRSGVGSGGNGPLMRAPVLGAAWESEAERLEELVDLSTRLTHTHPEAVRSARLAAGIAGSGPDALEELVEAVEPGDTREACRRALEADSVEQLAEQRGWRRGVPGYAPETLSAALLAARQHPETVRGAVEAAVRMGGDTDSVAALAGALVGAWCGPDAAPSGWESALGLPGIATAGWLRRSGWNLALFGLCLLHLPRRWLPGVWLSAGAAAEPGLGEVDRRG